MPRRWYLLPCRTFQPVVITTQSLPSAVQGLAYSFQYSANGGTPPYTWSLFSDTGTNTWNVSSSGVLTGTPTSAETDTITVQVTDTVGGMALSAPLSLIVSASGGSYTFDHFASPTGSDLNPGTLAQPWALTSINTKQGSFTQLGLIADQGPYVFATIGIPWHSAGAGFGTPVLNGPSGTALAPTVIAGCSSAGAFIGPSLKAVIDGSLNNPPTYGYDAGLGSGTSWGAILGCVNGAGNCIFDSLELKNGNGHAFLFDPASQMSNVQVRNCLWHHIYNYNEGFSSTASCNDATHPGVMNVTAISGGNVNDLAHSGPGFTTGSIPDGVFIPGTGAGQGNIQPYGTSGTSGTGGLGTYQLSSLTTKTFTASVGGATSGTLTSSLTNGTYTFVFSDSEARAVSITGGTAASWSPALSAGTITTATVYANFASQTINGSAQAGNNLSGCAIENITASIVYNCFCYAIVDLNTAINNNKRACGIKSFNCAGLTIDLCTVYADATTQMPVEGYSTKDSPCFNISITRSYAHLANAITGSSEAQCISADLIAGTGHTANYQNNVLVHPTFIGIPLAGSGAIPGPWSSLPITWAFNTCVDTSSVANSCAGFKRFCDHPAGAQNVAHYSNVYSNINGGTPSSSNNTIQSGGDVFNILDYDILPPPGSNGQMNFQPVGGGSAVRYSLPTQLAAFQAAVIASVNGGVSKAEQHGVVGNVNFTNASGTLLKATDYQQAPGSIGHNAGSTNGLTTGSITDCGAFGNGNTLVGCQWMDPF